MSEWREYRLADICVPRQGIQTGPFGSQLHKKDYVNSGTPIITVEHLCNNRITTQNLPMVSDSDKQRLCKYTLKKGDIVFSRVGSVDRRALIRQEQEGWLFSGRCLRVRLDTTKADPAFVSFQFGLETFKEYMRSIAVGATMPSLNTQLLSHVKILLPPLSEQKAIAHILGSLDDKIELNRRMNETLEAMARAIFKDWFVDFGPTRAKIEGRAPYLPEPIWSLFPDAIDPQSGLPVGWEKKPLPEVIDFKEGPGIRNWQYTNSEEGTRFINIRCIQDNDLNLKTANRITNDEANGKYSHFHLREWDIVVSTSGTLGRSAIVRKEHLPLVLNTSVIRFRPIDQKITKSFLFLYLNSPYFLEELMAMASGSVQKNFGPMHLKKMRVLTPPFDLVCQFEKRAGSLLNKVICNRSESDSLAELRDRLLPKLMSGQIRVKDAEKLVEEVL